MLIGSVSTYCSVLNESECLLRDLDMARVDGVICPFDYQQCIFPGKLYIDFCPNEQIRFFTADQSDAFQ